MAPANLYEVNHKVSMLDTRLTNLAENIGDRQDRMDEHLKSTDTTVESLKTFMIQTKALMVMVGIVWPLVVKYLLPK